MRAGMMCRTSSWMLFTESIANFPVVWIEIKLLRYIIAKLELLSGNKVHTTALDFF